MKHEKLNNILLTAALLAAALYFTVSASVKTAEGILTRDLYHTTTKQDRIKFVQDSIYNQKSIELRDKQIKNW